MFFVLIDAHSKWPEVKVMKSTTTEKTIEVIRSIFAQHGLPEQFVTDNGPQFISSDFEKFLKSNGIKHILSAPYHPASNGLAERFVQTLKRTLKAGGKDGKSIHHRLAEFLFEYRATPHATTNISPSELLMNRRLRTRFHLMSPLNTREHVSSKQASQKWNHDRHCKHRSLLPGSVVMVREYTHSTRWTTGVVSRKLGPVTYMVQISNGRIVKRHIDQLKIRNDDKEINLPAVGENIIGDNHTFPETPESEPAEPVADNTPQVPTERRYPQRVRHPPDRYIHESV